MARHPKIQLKSLREIGWREWNPIGTGLPADEYDTYLLNAAGQMVNGGSDVADADHLVSVEVDLMGLDPAPDVRERALVVASAIRAYVQTLGY